MNCTDRWIVVFGAAVAIAVSGCGGKDDTTGDADAGDTAETPDDTAADDPAEDADAGDPDAIVDTPADTPADTAVDTPVDTHEDPLPDLPEGELPYGYVDHLGTNNQDITGVTRVVFLGDSITATPYITSPWSDRIRDNLQALYGAGTEFRNYAAWGAQTDDVLNDQLGNIDTSSTKKTLVMFTIGGNDALDVIGEDIPTSLAHMLTRMENLRGILDWLFDPANFPGGVYVVFGDIYDPTDGEGDFTHCGIAAGYGDWPECDELATTVNVWYLNLAMEYGADLLRMHDLFIGHGWNNTDTANPYYCNGCSPDCPCPRWLDATCIHPSSTGHDALAGFFYDIVAR